MSIISLVFLHVFQQHMSIFVGSLLDSLAIDGVCLFIVHSGSFELLSAGWCRRWWSVQDSHRRQFCEPVTSECWSSSYWSTRRRIQVSNSAAIRAKFWLLLITHATCMYVNALWRIVWNNTWLRKVDAWGPWTIKVPPKRALGNPKKKQTNKRSLWQNEHDN